ERSWVLKSGNRFTLAGSGETRFNARFRSNEATVFSFGAIYRLGLSNGDDISLSAFARDTSAETPNGTFTSATLRSTYSFDKPLGPAKISATFGLGLSDYDAFLFSNPIGPRPRRDETVFADVTFFFEDYDYAGFAPTLKLRAERTKSNFSAFTSREFSVGLGIQSKF
ncbi:MAG: hypothetical protein AB3N11_04155, partial [Arenibacterium sp.]